MKFDFKKGDLVKSVAGHDEDRIYVVMSISGEFALVCDGEYRTIAKQKRKRQKHLRYAFDKGLTDKVLANDIKGLGQNPTDTDIKKIIKEWREYAERR